jgi:hypothetical protein
MSVQLKLRRDTAANISAFTPDQGELIIDTTNNRVVVGDGSTAGGSAAAKLSEIASLAGAPGLRNRLRNAGFAINQRAVSGTVTLAAGAYGHDGVKAGASGAAYTFAASGIDTVLTITAGSLILPIAAGLIEGGAYALQNAGTAHARVWQGTGYTGSGSYVSAPIYVSSMTAATQTNVEFSTGTVLRPQFEPGQVATAFERRRPSAELADCMSYYETNYGPGIPPGNAGGYGYETNAASTNSYLGFFVRWSVRKLASPTVVMYSPHTGTVNMMYNYSSAADIAAAVSVIYSDGAMFYVNGVSVTAGQSIGFNFTASAEI